MRNLYRLREFQAFASASARAVASCLCMRLMGPAEDGPDVLWVFRSALMG